MFASGTGSMRGPGLKTPLLLLLLLLLGTVFCQEEDDAVAEEDADTDIEPAEEAGDPEPEAATEDADVSESTLPPDFTEPFYDVETTIEEEQDGSGLFSVPYDDGSNTTDTTDLETDESLGLLIIVIPVVLVVLIIAFIVFCIFINRRWKQNQINQELRKEDPYLDGSSTEKVPMPMFEEDVPSVLELEMEDLDWMRKDDEPTEDSKHL